MHDRAVAVITGAGRGIGAATARRFAQRGWRVALLDRDAATVAAIATELGASCCWSGSADVSEYASLQRAAAEIAHVTDRVDVLVNNAGILRVGPFESISQADAEAQIRVNVIGTVNGVYAFFDALEATRGAAIVNLASASSIYGTPDFAVYSATKFAVRGLTEALEIEFRRRHDIRVCDISPPFVRGAMLGEQTFRPSSLDRLGVEATPETVAELVLEAALAKNGRVHYTLEAGQRALRSLSALPALTRPVMARLMGYG